jgi:hypothetical protein
MKSAVLLKIFAALAVVSGAGYIWLWYATGEAPTPWLIRIAAVCLLFALAAGVINSETRPRMMLRFLAALFALFTLISFAADVSRPLTDGPGAISLMQHLHNLTPAFLSALERTVVRATDAFAWDPVLTSILSLPATMIFLLLAITCGYLGRPRRRIRIFANDY